jgi:DNA gyrase subunit B
VDIGGKRMTEKRDQIKALTTREQCRDKLPTWFGSRENFLHGFREVLGNAVDEVTNNYSRGIINVTLADDMQTISVADTGRGIPIDGTTDDKPNYTLLFETLFAGTNYDNNDNGKITVGTNGVGTTVLNHTSTLFEVTSYKKGKKHKLTYVDGGVNKGMTTEDCKETLHGSVFKFRLDPEVYTNVIYKVEDVLAIIRHIAATANKITFNFTHKGEKTTYQYPTLQAYFDEIAQNLTAKPVIGLENAYNRENELNKITILFSTASEPIQESFLNYNWLPKGGAINDGVIAGVRSFVNKAALDAKLIDKKASITHTDVEDSVSFVVSMLSTNVEYANQTKLSTDKKLYRRLVIEYVQGLLEAYQAERPKEFDKFLKHIVQVNKFNNKNTAAKLKLKKALNEKVDSVSNRIAKLVDCDIHGPNSELFVAEGDSALTSIVVARDPEYQAAYPLRGKILNCLKADYGTIFKNQVILDLIRAMGCGVDTDAKNKDLGEFKPENMNYGRLVIATDADPDGQQIQCLIITSVYRLMRPLIEMGRVFIAKTPLYKVKLQDDTMIYYFTEQEKDEKLPKLQGKYTISRCKGLGELDPHTMSYTAMDKDTRELIQVTLDDAEEMIKSVEMFMGAEIKDRKEYIENNLYRYIEEVV